MTGSPQHGTVSRLARHAHRSGFAVALPVEWEVRLDPRPDTALLGLAPEVDPWGFRTNVVVTLDPLDRGMTLRNWQAGADQMLPAVLVDYLLLDLEHVHVGERAGVRRLGHHATQGRAVTMEQWSTIADGRGYTLTASVSTLAYPALADELAAIAATFQVEEAGEAVE